MDRIKHTYGDDSSSDDKSEDANDNVQHGNYFGLSYSDLDKQLDRAIEREFSVLKDSIQVHENAFNLSSSSIGPEFPSTYSQDYQEFKRANNSIYKKPVINRELATQGTKCNKESFSNKTDSAEEASSNSVCWEEVLQVKFREDKHCKPCSHFIFNHQLSTKCLNSVQWNNQFCNLLLTTSLDGSVRIWDYSSRRVLSTLSLHPSGVKAGVWNLDGRKMLTGGFDKFARLTDLVTGCEVLSCPHKSTVSSVRSHLLNPSLFLTGTFNCICAWDSRTLSDVPIRKFSANCKQVLCMAFLPGSEEFVCSTEVVSRDSADRTIMAWDLGSGALLSNQIYQERFTCPWLGVDFNRNKFLAQSTGNYIAEFSAQRPYKMNKYKRYEGHSLSGYNISCSLSKDFNLVASGDSRGAIYIYRVGSGDLVRHLDSPEQTNDPSVSLDWHPKLASLLAVGTWNGHLQFWS